MAGRMEKIRAAFRDARVVAFVLSFLLLAGASMDLFHWLARFVFGEPREDMAHGWFVPLFSLAILWMRRREIAQGAGAPSLCGLVSLLIGLFLFAVGTLGDQVRITHIAAIWSLWSIAYALWGRRLAREVLFPAAFLLFTVPMSFLDAVTVKLRMAIAVAASVLLNGFGLPVSRSGTGLYCLAGEGFNLDIADPCSGLRSIFALMALSAAYGYLTQKNNLARWLLFIASVPVAMLGNLARIFSIAVVAGIAGQKAATGFYHDYSGYVVFVVAILCVMWLGGVLQRRLGGAGGRKEEPPRGEDAAPRPLFALFSVIVPLSVAGMWLAVANAPKLEEEPVDFIAQSLGEIPGYSLKIPWFCQNEQCGAIAEYAPGEVPEAECALCRGEMHCVSPGERNKLPQDTAFLKGNYHDTMGKPWRVTVVVNGKTRQSIHRPEVCLPAQGLSIEKSRVEDFRLESGGTLSIHTMELRHRSLFGEERFGHGYFFISRDRLAASHLRRILASVCDRAFRRRITRWAMVTISADEPFSSGEGRTEETQTFLSGFFEMLAKGRRPEGGCK